MKFSDLKYLFAYTVPISVYVSITSSGIMTFITPFYVFVIIPILELLVKDYESTKDYSESEKNNRVSNIFFDIMLYLNFPIVFSLLLLSFVNLNSLELANLEIIGIVLSTGILLATNSINVAHELGHRQSRIDKTISKILYLPCLYMHFFIEHNYGHHKNIATPNDPATAKLNQSIYSFWFTSVVNQYINAWTIQLKLLKDQQMSFFSLKNDMLFYTIFQSLYLFIVLFSFGVDGLIYSILIALISFLFLECINYIEHYGLQRIKLPSGRYERVQPHHSWNSNHFIGRIVLYELTRHSDHHYKASKKYQVLENKIDSPQLPFGYPGSILLALIPFLWFYIINPILVERN